MLGSIHLFPGQSKGRKGEERGRKRRGEGEGEGRKTKENMLLYYVFLILKKTVEMTNKLLNTQH